MFQTILVATDGSEHAEKAVAVASELAATNKSKLILMHVVEEARLAPAMLHMAEIEHLLDPLPAVSEPGNAGGKLTVELTRVRDEAEATRRVMRTLGERVLSRAKRSASAPGIRDVESVIEEGGAAERIVGRAERENADLIVLGSRGRSDLKGLLLGSVSHKVCHLAPCSCITVK